MMAAVLKSPETLELQEVEMPKCLPGGMLLKTKACSICSTDVKMVQRGQKDLVYPRILGHEMAGVIVESNAEGSNLKVGDRVQVHPGIGCGNCIPCRRGADNLCQSVRILGFNYDGGFAEYVQIPMESVNCGGINPLPEWVSFENATFVEPLACCLNGQQLSRVGNGDIVLIFGAGPIGCLHAMLARQKGASTVIMVEPLENRVFLAKYAGSDLVIDSSKENVGERVMDVTDGCGADVIMLASRDVIVDDALLSLLAFRGRLCLFSGLPQENAISNLNLNEVHYQDRLITGAYGCTRAQGREALDLISSGALDINWLISKRISLGNIKQGIENASLRDGLKIVISKFGTC